MKIKAEESSKEVFTISSLLDVMFILIIFFLVCASVQPELGRPQEIPKSEEEPEKEDQSENPEVELTRTAIILNGDPVADATFAPRMASVIGRLERPEDKVVLLKSRKDVPYDRWISVTGIIEQAGGTITLQIEEEQAEIVQ